MDDLIFSVDTLDNDLLIDNKLIKLFCGLDIRNVNWSGNRKVVPVLSNFDKDVLAAAIRERDLSLDINEILPRR